MVRSQKETARYVAELCEELRKLTHGASLDTLTYLLEITALEAARLARPEPRVKSAA